MFADALALTLLPGPLDQTVFSPRCQTELQRFDDQLRAGGIRAETVTFRTADGAGRPLHRARVMEKMKARSIVELVRLADRAGVHAADDK
jgi:hypothetical protein